MQDWSGIPSDVDASFRDVYGTKQHLFMGSFRVAAPFLKLLPERITELRSALPARLSGYAHFIRGRQYWKFDPVGMNSLEGYPRYVGMDFFACRNV